jgi:hypothetical protein
MCLCERYLQFGQPVRDIADIASVSYRAYKAGRWAKRKLAAYINSHRKQEESLSHKYWKPCAVEATADETNADEANADEANADEANATDAPRPPADEDRNSILVKKTNRSFLDRFELSEEDREFLAQLYRSEGDPKAPEILDTKGIDLDAKPLDEQKRVVVDVQKLGKLEEALYAHPSDSIVRLDATLPRDRKKLVKRWKRDQSYRRRCAV